MFNLLYSWRWWIWCGCLAAWTSALLLPIPQEEPLGILERVDVNTKYLLAKSLHASAYAFLTVLSAWLRAPLRFRFLLVFLLMVHGTTTEMLQMIFESLGRTGLLTDVAIDNTGVAAGLLVSWRWWTADV